MSWTGGTTLTISGWNGDPINGGGTSRLFVGTDATGLSRSQLAQINFNGYTPGAMMVGNEVVPVPEARTILGMVAAGMGLAGWVRRRAPRRTIHQIA